MARMKVILQVTIILSVAAFLFAQAIPEHGDRTVMRVSLIRVIANPKEFDGRTLRITGYLDNNGLDRSLGVYLSDVDGRNFIISNSVDLDIEGPQVKSLTGGYVALQGVYHAPVPHSDSNGYIDRILSIKAWKREGVATRN